MNNTYPESYSKVPNISSWVLISIVVGNVDLMNININPLILCDSL